MSGQEHPAASPSYRTIVADPPLLAADEPLGVWFWRQVYEWNPKAKVPQKKHSAKPSGFFELIEQVAPAPRLELFAREQRLGWDTWGDEAFRHVELSA